MNNSLLPQRDTVEELYKTRLSREFDLVSLAFEYLLRKKGGGFIPYSEIRLLLCRRFSFPKAYCKKLINVMEEEGLLIKCKRGVVIRV